MSSLLGVFDAVCLETSRLHERSELVTLPFFAVSSTAAFSLSLSWE